jgi:CPA2 family monovalent cation:H+ antiporter-2
VHVDPLLPLLATVALTLFVSGFVLKKLGQPYVVGYLLGGVVIGPHVLGIVSDAQLLSQLGGLGVVLLLFFVGMEISPERVLANWKVAAVGTGLQIVISVGCIWVLGALLDWSLARIVLLGFVISLSSTAVVLRLVQEGRFASPAMGDQVTGILLVQDVALVPMLLVLGFLGAGVPSASLLVSQAVGAVIVFVLVLWVARPGVVRLPMAGLVSGQPELQVFASLIICFGLGLLTGLLGLSTALGAFVAGLIVSAARETHWIHSSLEPFRVVFVALFFVSVGMLLDVDFVLDHWPLVLGLTLLVLGTNTFINAAVLRFFGNRWRESLMGGALLAQVGELSYLLAAVGVQAGIVSQFSHQVTIAMITLSLVFSPAWLFAWHRVARK